MGSIARRARSDEHDPDSEMTLAELLEQSLEAQDKTKVELADHLQVSNTSLTKWTRKHRPPDPIPWRHWKAICRFLRIPWHRWWRVALHDQPRNAACYQRFTQRF